MEYTLDGRIIKIVFWTKVQNVGGEKSNYLFHSFRKGLDTCQTIDNDYLSEKDESKLGVGNSLVFTLLIWTL